MGLINGLRYNSSLRRIGKNASVINTGAESQVVFSHYDVLEVNDRATKAGVPQEQIRKDLENVSLRLGSKNWRML